jgi:monoamine oxidase
MANPPSTSGFAIHVARRPAGTETAEVFMGYMDGAVRSGERAASEVRAEL